MKRKIFYTMGAILVAGLTLGAVANGPYYAFPAWSQKLICAVGNCPRFIVLSDWNSAAVLDRETALVWEQSPGTATRSWIGAFECYQREVGGRKGWRLPTVEELASLVDSTQSNPALPSGHPFSNVQSSAPASAYWSATTLAANTTNAWRVTFFNGQAGPTSKDLSSLFVWCVRGGHGHDGQ